MVVVTSFLVCLPFVLSLRTLLLQCYHSGRDSADRSRTLRLFCANKLRVVRPLTAEGNEARNILSCLVMWNIL